MNRMFMVLKWLLVVFLAYIYILSTIVSFFPPETNESGKFIIKKNDKKDSIFVYIENKNSFNIKLEDIPQLNSILISHSPKTNYFNIDNTGNVNLNLFGPHLLIVFFVVLYINLKIKYKKEQKLRLILLHELEDGFRKRGSNLHDVVINPLKGLAKNLPKKVIKDLESEIPEDDAIRLVPKLHSILRKSSEQIIYMANKAHDIYRDISPPIHLIGFKSTVESYIEELRMHHPGIKIDLNFQGDPQLDPKLGIQLFRILQEAIGNSVLHGKSNHIQIKFLENNNINNLYIEDNGIGFLVPKDLSYYVKQQHTGIANMQFRSSSIGAKFTIESKKGKGTFIIVTFPSNHKI